MAKNHESVLWVGSMNKELYGKFAKDYIFRTRAAARYFMRNRAGTVRKAVWGPDNIKVKAK